MENVFMYRFTGFLLSMLVGLPASAQVSVQREDQNVGPQKIEQRIGSAADTGVGRVGQRQTRQETNLNIKPMERVETRIANRIQNRIRNRIDADYDPAADLESSFRRAREQKRNLSYP